MYFFFRITDVVSSDLTSLEKTLMCHLKSFNFCKKKKKKTNTKMYRNSSLALFWFRL